MQKKQSGFGIASLIFGIIGMVTTFIFIGIIPCVVGLILGCIGVSQKDRSRGLAIVGLICSIIGIFIFGTIFYLVNKTDNTGDISYKSDDHQQNTMISTDIEESYTEETTETNIDTNETNKKDESEQEYKNSCIELWNEDIFFSDDDLEGYRVKLCLFVEELKFFEHDNIYNSVAIDFINEHNLQREFLDCGVLRKDANSYVGGQISLYFSDDGDYKASDFEIEKKIIIYGDIVDYSTNTWDGYNTCGIVPRYIEILE